MDGIKPKYQDRVEFVELNLYDSSSEADAQKYGVRVHPTFVTAKPDGTEADQIIGGTDEQRMIAAIEKALQ